MSVSVPDAKWKSQQNTCFIYLFLILPDLKQYNYILTSNQLSIPLELNKHSKEQSDC